MRHHLDGTDRSSPLLRSRLGLPYGDGRAWTSPTSLKICQSVRDERPLKILQSVPPGWQVVSFSEILQRVCGGRRDIIPLFRMLLGRDGRVRVGRLQREHPSRAGIVPLLKFL